MAKFPGLIKNEFVKIFKKLSTWIALIILVVITGGFSFIASYELSFTDYEWADDDTQYRIEMYKEEITYAKEAKNEGWEQVVELNQFYIDNNIMPTSWRYSAAQEAIQSTLSQYKYTEDELADLKETVKNNDYKAYAELLYSLLEDSEKDTIGWEYKYYLDRDITPDSLEPWKSSMISTVALNKSDIYNMETDPSYNINGENAWEYHELLDQTKLLEYRIEHDIKIDIDNAEYDYTGSFWTILQIGLKLANLVAILSIIVAGSIVATEFSQGTIKFLLVNPVSRWKILTSKYITVIVYDIILVLLMFLTVCISGILIYGTSDIGMEYATIKNGNIVAMPAITYMLKTYALNAISTLVISTLAFAISSVMRSTAFAIGISMFVMFGGTIINEILVSALGLDYGRFLIFANLNLVTIVNGYSNYQNHTIGFALAVIAVHMVIFLWTAWDGFTRREV